MTPRPKTADGQSTATTPRASTMMALLGAATSRGNVTISHDEHRAASRLYGLVPEKPNARPPEPTPPEVEDSYFNHNVWQKYRDDLKAWHRWEDPRPLLQAGADRDLARWMETDGMRIVAWIAKYVSPGADPLRTVVQMAIGAGYDVDPDDVEWAERDVDEGHDRDEEVGSC